MSAIHVAIYISEVRICQQILPIRLNNSLRIYWTVHIVRVLKHGGRRHEEEREQEQECERHHRLTQSTELCYVAVGSLALSANPT